MVPFLSFAHLSDAQLRAELPVAASTERTATARVIALLAEYDKRRLYFDDGFNSLFAYCTGGLLLSESAAYTRIQAARAARKWPSVLEALTEGSITLTAVGLLAPHLTDENWQWVLAEVRHKKKADVERLVARLHPQPDVRNAVRKLPSPRPASAPAHASAPAPAHAPAPAPAPAPAQASAQAEACGQAFATAAASAPAAAPAYPQALAEAPVWAEAPAHAPGGGPPVHPARPAVITPLTPERYRLQITIDEETRDALRQAQDLMRHSNPTGDPAVVVSRALRVLVDDLLKKKAGITNGPRDPGARRRSAEGSRAVPARVKRAVWKRDRGRCTFEGPRGRCPARSPLEYHHIIPYAMGGGATPDNIELRCRAHNAYQAALDGLGWGGATPPLSSG